MRALAVTVFMLGILSLAGCGAAEKCSASVSCGGGSYTACSDGNSCRFTTSDGKSKSCASCADCQAALVDVGNWCDGGNAAGGNGIGGNGTGGNGTSGEPQACVAYLACAAAATPAQFPALAASYGPTGTCWQSTPALAGDCATACASGLSALQAAPNAPAACATTTIPTGGQCGDHLIDGAETDVDCGGADCPPCSIGLSCAANSDCNSSRCLGQRCAAAASFYADSIYSVADGASASGSDGGFVIARNGTTVRIVWNNDGAIHTFSGAIYAPAGIPDGEVGCHGACGGGFFIGAATTPDGPQITFGDDDIDNPTILHGLDITIVTTPVYFDLYVDGQRQPGRVFFTSATTGQAATPGEIPFGLQ